MSLLDKIRKYSPKGLVLGASMLGILAMNGCDSIMGNKKKGGEDPFVNTPSEISFSPLEGRVGEPYTANLKVSDKDGLKSIEVLGPDSTWVYDVSGSDFSVNINKDFQTEGQRSILIKTTDAKDDVTQKGFIINVAPRTYVNTPPKLEVSLESNQIDEAKFRIKASDNKLIDRLELNYGNETETIFVNRADIDTLITRNYGNEGGSFNFSARAVDNEGASTQEFKDFDLTGRTDLNLEWRTYFEEMPIHGAKIYLTHQAGLLDTVLVSQNGEVNGLNIPKGEYAVLLHANPSTILPSKDGEFISNITRMRIPSRDFLPEEYEGSFWHGREDTYVISGPSVRSNLLLGRASIEDIYASYEVMPSEVRFNLILDKNLNTLVETLDNLHSVYPTTVHGRSEGYLLEELSRQTFNSAGMTMIPKVDEPLIFVHNWGDRNCPDNWNSQVDLICTLGLLPGVRAFEQDKQNFDVFFNDLMSIMNDPKIGGNPYDVRKIAGYSENISSEVLIDPENYHGGTFYGPLRDAFKNGVVYSGHTGGGTSRELFVRNRGPPYFIDRSLANVARNSVPSIFANEMTIFSPNESRIVTNVEKGEFVLQPIFGSVRDPPAFLASLGYDYRHPEYGVIPANTTFHKKDVSNIKVLLGFSAYAQKQYLNGVKDHWGVDLSGFNLHLHNRYIDD
jgi:hypothetical protein